MRSPSSPSLDVYVSGYNPVPSFVPYWPESWQATWPATTSTLSSGATDAVALVNGRCEMSPTEALARSGDEYGVARQS